MPVLLASTMTVAVAVAGTPVLNHSVHIPFSWDTLPRYTFCGNVSFRLAILALPPTLVLPVSRGTSHVAHSATPALVART